MKKIKNNLVFILSISLSILYNVQMIKAQSPTNVNNTTYTSGMHIFTDPQTIVSPSDNSTVNFSGTAQVEYQPGALVHLQPGFSVTGLSGNGYFHGVPLANGSNLSAQAACPNLLDGTFENGTHPDCGCITAGCNPNSFNIVRAGNNWTGISSCDYLVSGVSLSPCSALVASPHTGNANAGLGTTNNNATREFLLNNVTVVGGRTYKIEFFYKINDPGNRVPPLFGVYVSGTTITDFLGSFPSPLNNIETLPGITDHGYTKVTSYYTENRAGINTLFFAIGAFTPLNITKDQYYFVDDVSITESPDVTITGSTSVCSGDNFSIGFAASNGSNYSWSISPSVSPSNFILPNTSSTATFSGPINTTLSPTYTVTLTANSASGCATTNTFVVNVTGSPIPTPIIAPNLNICQGNSVMLNTNTPFRPIQWYLNGNVINGATSNI